MVISMDATTNFLTAPVPAQRGNDVLADSAGGEGSASGAQFAGVLNGQMLKLERQALASSHQESSDLQVLRLGNKLNVITTDAPLPDLASLADFARAQGLGDAAVQALFGSASTGVASTAVASVSLASVSAIASDGSGSSADATALLDSGNLQAAQALAQSAATSLIQLALTSTAPGAVASENWLLQRGLVSGTADAAEALMVKTGDDAPALPTDALSPLSALYALRNRGLASGTAQVTLGEGALPTERLINVSAQSTKDGANPLEEQDAQERTVAQEPDTQAPDTLAAAALVAAVQAGLGMVPVQHTTALDEPAVTVTNLSIEKPASSQLASLRPMELAVLASAKIVGQLSGPESLAAVGEEAPTEPQADLQIRLVPPDQAITQRLAQMTGKSKPIDWSALLAGQKVSDTLAGLAQSPMPAMSDAQAKLVAQMQANGQLPPSGDQARNDLLAKLQVQAASAAATPAALGAPTGTPAWASPADPQFEASAPAFASQSASAASQLGANDKAQTTLSALAMQGTGVAQTLEPARTNRLWESVRIELPSGLLLEALEEHQAQKSDAEPSLPTSASAASGAATSLSHSLASDKAQVATPQALAEQRAAQYQEVADQLGEAMARRLMAQIERGQWKMQLRMQPAVLGTINVELDMHAKGLDATFTSDNAVTRELMTQGSARLRDTLTQTGTTVASVVVNGDSGRQSGGNSTPGQKPKSGQNADNKKIAAQALVQTAAMPPAAQGDGLNVLA
jgi:flagellar hook-length control protein FliK